MLTNTKATQKYNTSNSTVAFHSAIKPRCEKYEYRKRMNILLYKLILSMLKIPNNGKGIMIITISLLTMSSKRNNCRIYAIKDLHRMQLMYMADSGKQIR